MGLQIVLHQSRRQVGGWQITGTVELGLRRFLKGLPT